MGASGAIVMGFFDASFASLTLLLQWKWSGLGLALPFAGFVVIAAMALLVARRPGEGFMRPDGSGEVMMWSSIGEGIALFIGNELVINLGRPDLIIPTMALVVGLHFVPIAYYSPFRPLYPLAAVMVLGGSVGLALAQPAGGVLAGFTAAAALAVSSIAAVHREWAAKKHSFRLSRDVVVSG